MNTIPAYSLVSAQSLKVGDVLIDGHTMTLFKVSKIMQDNTYGADLIVYYDNGKFDVFWNLQPVAKVKE